jgi:hypothetical protein
MNWSVLIVATLRLYQQAAKETWQKVPRNWWVGLLPLLYGPLFFLVAVLVAPLGMASGFILGFIIAVCVSSYLYFIAGVVAGEYMSFQEVIESWRPFFGPVTTILFFLFLVGITLSMLPPVAGGEILFPAIYLILLIILNPIPEIIYQGRSGGFDMLQESVEFLRENGIEWFVPLAGLVLFVWLFSPLSGLTTLFALLQLGTLGFSTSFLWGSLTGLVWSALSAFLLFVLMVFRGLLFRALSGSTRRQRIYRSRFS